MSKGLNEEMKDKEKEASTETDDNNETVKEAIETFKGLLANAYRPEDQPPTEEYPKKNKVPDKSDTKIEEDLDESFNALFEGQEGLSEDFKLKLGTIFEAKVHEKVCAVKETIEEAATAALSETVERIKSQMEESVDNYLSYVATQFVKENEIAITEGLRYEIAESFMEGLKTLFVEHNVEIPEEKVDLVSVMEEKIADLETIINETAEEVGNIIKENSELKEKAIFENMTASLAETEKDKISKLAESISFTSEEDYSKRLGILIESYTGAKKVADEKADKAVLNEETSAGGEKKRSSVSVYADFINSKGANRF